MAHLIHAENYSAEEALMRIKSERSRRAWLALLLFTLSAAALAVSFYLSYRDLPAPASPAVDVPGLADP